MSRDHELYKQTTHTIDYILSKFSNDDMTKGYILIVFHNIFMGVLALYLLIGRVASVYYISVLLLLLIFISNVVFRGCVLLKMERKYINSKGWYGGYHILEYLGFPLNTQMVVFYYYVWVLFLFVVLFTRIIRTRMS